MKNLTYLDLMYPGTSNNRSSSNNEFETDDLSLLIEMISAGGTSYEELIEKGYSINQIINADMNQDGVVDNNDLIQFIEEFGGTI